VAHCALFTTLLPVLAFVRHQRVQQILFMNLKLKTLL